MSKGPPVQKDSDLFLSWAADAFLAAGRADKPEQRRCHRRRAELFCDIFHELSRSPDRIIRAEEADIGDLLVRAYASADTDKS
jgi:hypothetical protein